MSLLLSAAAAFLAFASAPTVPGVTILTARQLRQVANGISPAGPSTRNVAVGRGHSVAAGRLVGRNGRPEVHRRAGRVFVVTAGHGRMRVGGTITAAASGDAPDVIAPDDRGYRGYRTIALEPGTMVNIDAGTPYQLLATASDFTFLVVRVTE